MKALKILPVKEYNRQAMNRWNQRIAEWKTKPIGTPMPQLAFFVFQNRDGSYRRTGFIASVIGQDAHYFGRTRKEATSLAIKE